MHKVSLIYVTCPNKIEAQIIAKTLVQEKLISCANIINNVTSIFEYENKFHEEDEAILILKTLSIQFQKIEDRIIELHSYDIPCIIEVSASNSSKKFTDWLYNQLNKST